MSTFRVSPYAPANETESDLWFERSNIDGAVVGGVAYGVHVTLFLVCMHILWHKSSRLNAPVFSYGFMLYISLMFVLGTIGNAANTRFNEMTFVDNRDYPGGPNQFFIDNNSYWFNVMGYGVYIGMTWLQDGLLLYRFYIIWSSNRWVLVIPTLSYLVSLIMSCFLLAQIAQPGNNIWESLSINFALAYWSCSIGTTILVTSLIVARLTYLRYQLRKVMGAVPTPYLSISSMLIESAFLYSSFGLIFIVSFARNSPVQNIFLPPLGQVQAIAPLLIIIRVAQGRGLTKTTVGETSGVSAIQWGRLSQQHLGSTIVIPAAKLDTRYGEVSSSGRKGVNDSTRDFDFEIGKYIPLQVYNKSGSGIA